MSTTATPRIAEFLERTLRPEADDLTPDEARRILTIRFDDRDLERMHELAMKNQREGLSYAEEDEMRTYRTVGMLIDVLRAKAQRILKKSDHAAEPSV